MEQIVNQIIAVEKRAQEIMDEARKMREELPETITKDIEKMKEKYTVQAEQRLEVVRMEEKKFLQEATEEIKRLKEKELAVMEEKYQKNHEEWLTTLFYRITGGVPNAD